MLRVTPRYTGHGLQGDIIMGDLVLEISERIRGLVEQTRTREEGQGLVEYSLILMLIAIVVVVIVSTLGHTVNNVFSNVSGGLSS